MRSGFVHTARPWQLVSALAALGLLAACTPPKSVPGFSPQAELPVDQGTEKRFTVGDSASNTGNNVSFEPTEDASQYAKISTYKPKAGTNYGGKTLGAIVKITNEKTLTGQLKIVWDMPDWTHDQRAHAVVVRWNPRLKAWESTGKTATVDGNKVSALVDTPTTYALMALKPHAVAHAKAVVGTQTKRPECSDKKLPEWVSGVLRPDDGQDDPRILTCFEPRKNKNRITLKARNNRSVSQYVHSLPANHWSSVDRGSGTDQEKLAWLVYGPANELAPDRPGTLIPPQSEVHFHVANPEDSKSTLYQASTSADWYSAAADAAYLALHAASIEPDTPRFDMIMRAYIRCGFNKVADQNTTRRPKMPTIAELFHDCADTVESIFSTDNDPKLKAHWEASSGGLTNSTRFAFVAQSMSELADDFKRTRFFPYLADLKSTHAQPASTISYRTSGKTGTLGNWSADCGSAETMAKTMRTQLTEHDRYQGKDLTSRVSDTWEADLQELATPALHCSPKQRAELWNAITSWEDISNVDTIRQFLGLKLQKNKKVVLTPSSLGDLRFPIPLDKEQDLIKLFGEPDKRNDVGGCGTDGKPGSALFLRWKDFYLYGAAYGGAPFQLTKWHVSGDVPDNLEVAFPTYLGDTMNSVETQEDVDVEDIGDPFGIHSLTSKNQRIVWIADSDTSRIKAVASSVDPCD